MRHRSVSETMLSEIVTTISTPLSLLGCSGS
jgi:hypothetical protein